MVELHEDGVSELMVKESVWEVTFEYFWIGDVPEPGYTYCVVERDSESGRTIREVASGLSPDEAYAVANARETLSALAGLWDAIHREDHEDYFDSELVGDELKVAFDVLMRAKGVKA